MTNNKGEEMAEQIKPIKGIRVEAWVAANGGIPVSKNPYQVGTDAHQVWAEQHKQVMKHPIADRAEA